MKNHQDELSFERSLPGYAHAGDIKAVQRLLEKGIGVNSVDRFGFSALHFACRQGHKEVVALLLDHNASPDAQTLSDKATPLVSPWQQLIFNRLI